MSEDVDRLADEDTRPWWRVEALGLSEGVTMKTERMPWTCRWSEFRPATQAPMWMDAWMAQWACLAEHKRDVSTALDRCEECQKWESRNARVETPPREREHRP